MDPCRVFITGLPPSYTDHKLGALLGNCGLPVASTIYRSKYGLLTMVDMASLRDAAKVRRALACREVEGHSLAVISGASPHVRELEEQFIGLKAHRLCGKRACGTGTRLLVDGLPATVSNDRLREVFASHGTVISALVISSVHTPSVIIGSVGMATVPDAERAAQALHRTMIENHMVLVFPSHHDPSLF